MDISIRQFNAVMAQHNRLVKPRFYCEDLEAFLNWLVMAANTNEHYVEVPSYQTLSGHAEIIDLDADVVNLL